MAIEDTFSGLSGCFPFIMQGIGIFKSIYLWVTYQQIKWLTLKSYCGKLRTTTTW